MTIMCAASGCKSRVGALCKNGQKISFHRFPKNPELKLKWIRNMRREDWNASIYSRLCSLHFEKSCYQEGLNRKVLHSYAIPTIFSPHQKILEKFVKKRQPVMKIVNIATASESQDENNSPPVIMGPSTRPESKEKKTLRNELAHYKMLATKRGQKLRNLQRKCLRMTKKQADLEAVLNELQTIIEDQMAIVENTTDLDNPIIAQFLMKVHDCCIEIKQFAFS